LENSLTKNSATIVGEIELDGSHSQRHACKKLHCHSDVYVESKEVIQYGVQSNHAPLTSFTLRPMASVVDRPTAYMEHAGEPLHFTTSFCATCHVVCIKWRNVTKFKSLAESPL